MIKTILCIAAFITPMFADDASKMAKVEEFFKLSQIDKQLEAAMSQTMNQVKSGMIQQMIGGKLTPEQQRSVDDYTAKVGNLVQGALSWEKLKTDYTKIYAETFTEQELDDIIAFYRSKSGQAMVEKGRQLIPKGMAVAQKRMAEVMPELQKLMRDFAASAPKN